MNQSEDGIDVDIPSHYEKVPINEAFPKSMKFIGVFFSANYCPPCKKVMEPLKNFYKEFNKDSLQLQIVLVNCDKKEKDYKEHLAEMPWILAVPFDHTEVINRLEDMA